MQNHVYLEFFGIFNSLAIENSQILTFWLIMGQLPGFNDPIDMDSWNLDTQNAQNVGNPIGYYHVFGHYLLRSAPPIPDEKNLESMLADKNT